MKLPETDSWISVSVSAVLILGAIAFLILWAMGSAYQFA